MDYFAKTAIHEAQSPQEVSMRQFPLEPISVFLGKKTNSSLTKGISFNSGFTSS
jgi:hypothetical protein